MAPTPKVAFVAGANGISGNAIIEHLIRTPKTEWTRIVITSRSPLKNYWQDPRIEFIALDFLKPAEELIVKMRKLCGDVTHAFFTSYIHVDDFAQLKALNTPLFQNFLTALDTVAPLLERICLQTGGKHYGVHLGPVEVPIHEGMSRYEDYGQSFYYPQEDILFALAAKRTWSYNIVRPQAIIGFTPGGNGMSEALTLALYILCCRELGTAPAFPGNEFFYNSVDDNSYAPSLADMSVWAVSQEHTKNEDFVHTNGDVFVWRYFWPQIGRYYGVDIPDVRSWGTASEDGKMTNAFKMGEWAKDKQEVWDKICSKYGGSPEVFKYGTWGFFDWAIGKAWPTIGTASKARKMGWTRYDDTYESWVETFRTFENAGVLPRQSALGVTPWSRPKLAPNPQDHLRATDPKAVLTNGTGH